MQIREIMPLTTPVALIIFNRPDLTEIVFAAIRQARPQQLLVIADGPRSPSEAEVCRQTRAIIDRVDWDCQVFTNFSETNLGCDPRVVSGLDWVFSLVESAIVLEDDCCPHPSFFTFCELLLDKYRDEERVMHIAGTNLVPDEALAASFKFSRLVPIWGWATWRRAWQQYDMEMSAWPEYKQTPDINYFRTQANNISKIFEANYTDITDNWDAQWAFSCIVKRGLTIIPKTNLIDNLGFRADATHTKGPSHLCLVPVKGIEVPLRAPDKMQPDRNFDVQSLEFINGKNTLRMKLQHRAKTIAKKILNYNS